MNLTISPEAMQWFKKELVVDQGSGIRFFGKIYGKTQVHDGFSVGMSVDKPERPIVEQTIDGLLFLLMKQTNGFSKAMI